MATTANTVPGATARRMLANAVRVLAMDAVQKANSGHPGMPMGMADIAEVLWNDFLKHNPENPAWPDRDRFVLSNGHGSMLLYAVAHLSGYALGMDELADFRQLGSRTAGHPERDLEIGIETTTGPLGQGITNAVGMALAERLLAARFNRPGFDIVDHYTYAFVGDGCLMEGISHEACSLAGTLGLGRLICLYDDNGISIDGDVKQWFADDTPARFRAYGWHVVDDVDGHDAAAIAAAISAARDAADRPSLICCKTTIGYGAPNKQGSESTHGAPLGDEEIAAARVELDWCWPPFDVPEDVRAGWDARDRGRAVESSWQTTFDAYAGEYPELAVEFKRRNAGELPDGWAPALAAAIRDCQAAGVEKATRASSRDALEILAPRLPELFGGSADLTGSNCTLHSGSTAIEHGRLGGNYLYYGVREFAMAAMMNGLSLHGGWLPYGGTFLTFSDYSRNALRMAALMRIPAIHVFTHDSIGLGEDGPTHQPVEHVASLRIMPGMTVWRPCDAVETLVAWRDAAERRDGPTSLVLSRQKLRHQDRIESQLEGIGRGGYVLVDSGATPDAIIIATGSEVELACDAANRLAGEGIATNVVSMPCTSIFDAQDTAWRHSVLPPDVRVRVAVEAGVTDGWHRYVGDAGSVIGLDRFGESAPARELFESFGITAGAVVAAVKQALENGD